MVLVLEEGHMGWAGTCIWLLQAFYSRMVCILGYPCSQDSILNSYGNGSCQEAGLKAIAVVAAADVVASACVSVGV